MAANFSAEEVILILTLNENIKAVVNYNNSYNEKEIIVAPNKFRVINKYSTILIQ